MKVRAFIYLLLILGLISCEDKSREVGIQIQWTDDFSDDFSFRNNWSYPEGIYRNEFGQLVCDGICPSEIENMADENGRVFTDSLSALYNLIDTTHLFHSINSESNAYEWFGTDFIDVKRINKDTVICTTQNNAATHSSLNLVIVGNVIKPTIILESINSINNITVYSCLGGKIFIDKELWQKGILKASFYFNFEDKESPSEQIYWKGEIYSKIDDMKRA